MKAILKVIILVAFVLAACTGNVGSSQHDVSGNDTLYTEGKAMSIYRSEPERAMAIIDSGIIVGNITPGRGKYLKAVTQYGGTEDLSGARQMCLELVEERPDSETLQQTYQLLTLIEYSFSNLPAVILYATEASRRAHDLDMPIEVSKMEGYIAQAMSQTGRTSEGIDRLRTTIANLRQMDSFASVTAYHNTSKKLLHILLDNERYADMVPICESMLERIGELAQHPESFTGMAEGFDPAEFIDFARGQSNAFLTVAYARQYEAAMTPPTEVTPAVRAQLLKKARMAEEEVMRTKWSQSLDCDRMMTSAYPHLGEFDRFDAAMARLDAGRTDTINVNYVISLELRSKAAEMRGQIEEAYQYLIRAINIQDSIDYLNQRDQINELATVYHLQEEQLARQQAEADARFFRWLTIAIIVILVLAIGFAAYFFYKRRETVEKNKALVRMIDEMHRHTTLPERVGNEYSEGGNATDTHTDATDSPLPCREGVGESIALFQRFTTLIHDEQLYRDVSLDRDAVCQRLGIDRHALNQLLNTYADGLSLPAYINNVRLDVAYELLRDEPEKSIADIAAAVGFTPQNLRLQFKRRYGITPTDYRQNR
jgi:AraC-like DNA-binding protein